MDNPNQQSDSPQKAKGQHANRPTASLWASFLSFIIAVAALAIALYCFEKCQTVKSNHTTADTTHTMQMQALQSELTQVQTNLSATQQNVTQLMRHMGDSQQQSILSQVAYLINVANLQLNVSHNLQAALHMLSLAQSKVEQLNDPRLFALDRVITKDINQLKAVPRFNIAQLIDQIDSLSDAVGTATLMPNQKDLSKAQKQSAEKVGAADANEKDKWYSRIWEHLSGIKDLIIIRKNNPDITPLLDAQQRILIKSTIQSKLLLAEYAAIQHNDTLYQEHLATVEKWIKTYFFDSIDRENLLAHLKVIQSINVSPHVPDINDTITVLNQTLNALSNVTTPPSASTTTPQTSKIPETAKPTKTPPLNPKHKNLMPHDITTNNGGVAI